MTDFFHRHYQDEVRWQSYWLQIESILASKPATVLEIGPGSGVVSGYLRKAGIKLTTMDIDPATKPDIVGSVKRLPFPDGAFDAVLCAEVLEHLLYEDFVPCLMELRRAARNSVVVSLPHWGRGIGIAVRLPGLGLREWYGKLSGFRTHPPGGEHFWEIGTRGYPVGRIRTDMETAGFSVERTFLRMTAPYHRFFILKPIA